MLIKNDKIINLITDQNLKELADYFKVDYRKDFFRLIKFRLYAT